MYKVRRKVKINGKVRTAHCFVIPEHDKIVAKIRGCQTDAIEMFVRDTGFLPMDPERFMMQDTYCATVNRHPDDEWDETAGVDAAVAKLAGNYTAACNHKVEYMKAYIADKLTEARFKDLHK